MHYNRKPEPRNFDNILFGLHPMLEAIKAGRELDKVMLQDGAQGELIKELKALLTKHNIPYQYVPVEKLNRITSKNHQGVIAFVSEVTYQSIENIVPEIFERGEIPLLLLLDRVTDVRNTGAIIRTAECAGVQAIIIPARGSAQLNADAVKTSAGALHTIPICRENNLKETIHYLKECGIQIIGCTEKTEDYLYKVDFAQPTCIVMGSEEDGISSEYLKLCDARAKIPMHGKISSLNVSVSAGVILYEAVRQREAS